MQLRLFAFPDYRIKILTVYAKKRPGFNHDHQPHDVFHYPVFHLPYEKVDRLRAKAVKACEDEAFGLRSAEVYLPSQFGALAMVTRMCRLVYGDGFRLQAVNFKHEQPRDLQPYYSFFACELNFGKAQNQLFIPDSIVDEILTGANPELAMLNDEVVTRHLARIDKGDIVARLRAVLMDLLPNGEVSDDMVAAALHMSVRTLHRKLAEVDTNFRKELVEIRRSLAEQYIYDNSLTLTEISLLLGFSEPSSFSRAFRNWTGTSSSQVRQSRQ